MTHAPTHMHAHMHTPPHTHGGEEIEWEANKGWLCVCIPEMALSPHWLTSSCFSL